MRVPLHGHQILDSHRAVSAHPSQVVSPQIHQHNMFGALFGISGEFGFQLLVFVFVAAATKTKTRSWKPNSPLIPKSAPNILCWWIWGETTWDGCADTARCESRI